jgi:CBS domain-containing protein
MPFAPTRMADNNNDRSQPKSVSLPDRPTARSIMSAPVHGISADRLLTEARDLLLRYGHGCLLVTGMATPALLRRRDVDLAIHHGNGAARVGDYQREAVTIGPTLSLDRIAPALVTQGRVLVVENGQVIGLISHGDWHRAQVTRLDNADLPDLLRSALSPDLLQLLAQVGRIAEDHHLRPYIVGGVVRDLLRLPDQGRLTLVDVDLVVDGSQAGRPGAIVLAEAIQGSYPEVQLELFGKFQTAALTWPEDSRFGALGLDLATARSEFYPHPAANPEVEASTIGSDLYRRDFTINAMAIGMTGNLTGRLIDQFGGLADLRSGLIRVIHPHSPRDRPAARHRPRQRHLRSHPNRVGSSQSPRPLPPNSTAQRTGNDPQRPDLAIGPGLTRSLGCPGLPGPRIDPHPRHLAATAVGRSGRSRHSRVTPLAAAFGNYPDRSGRRSSRRSSRRSGRRFCRDRPWATAPQGQHPSPGALGRSPRPVATAWRSAQRHLPSASGLGFA